jgi:hypothetical protein
MEQGAAWQHSPDRARLEYLHAPIGRGADELRLQSTGELLLVGEGGHVAHRMSSILPAPFGTGRGALHCFPTLERKCHGNRRIRAI